MKLTIQTLSITALISALSSCAVVTTPVKIAGKVATTTVGVAGKVAGAGVDVVSGGSDDAQQ